jgi:inhibitor of KinA
MKVEKPWTSRLAGDSALLLELRPGLPREIATKTHASILRARPVGLRSVLPGSRSLLLKFDPLRLEPHALAAHVDAIEASTAHDHRPPRQHSIPICYEATFAPDLEEVAAEKGLKVADVIEMHSMSTYRVDFLGFMPGFAYLSGLPESLRVSRRSEARTNVPAGSVGIADLMTGIYPVETPGGWRLIGRSPQRLFDLDQDPPTLFQPGELVRFAPISAAEFRRIKR